MSATAASARPLAGRVALVTGASRGIGRATARALAEQGARVVVNYRTDEAAAATVVRQIAEAGSEALAIRADIACGTDVEHLFAQTMATFGQLDILVANAGYAAFGPLQGFDEAAFDRLFAVNAKGTFRCLQQAADVLADNGRIVCISTIGTVLNLDGGAAYFGSKAAVEQFCRVLARELAPRGITVNTVSPGFTATDMLAQTGATDAEVNAQIVAMTPLARVGLPEEVADVVCFLVGPQGRWINRQNLAADGGIISR